MRKLSGFSSNSQPMRMGHKQARLSSRVLLAGLALVIVTLSAGWGLDKDPEVKRLLLTPSAHELWQTQSKLRRNARPQRNESPLVQAAERLALLLNPPQSKAEALAMQRASSPAAKTAPGAVSPVRPKQSTAKFTLHATSYYPSAPDESMALIDEPGKGIHWVRQGTQVGYVVIHEIKRGMIFLRDGDRVQAMQVEAVKTPGPTPASQVPGEAQYAKHISHGPVSPVGAGSTEASATVAARRKMVPLKSRRGR